MNNPIKLEENFQRSREHLRGVAFRMLGSAADADDALQETWLRAYRSDVSDISNMTGWLTTIIGRICLDMLRARRSRHEENAEISEIEPILSQHQELGPEDEAVLADSVGLALLVVLDRLQPAERVAFVLHDMFAVPFAEIAEIVERSPAATKKMASRARQRVRSGTDPCQPDRTRKYEVVHAFLNASRAGDLDGLLRVLAPDVVRRADAFALREGEPASLHGARPVAEETTSNSHRTRFAQPLLVDGSPGAVVAPNGRLLFVLKVEIRGDRVSEVEIIGAPERLGKLDLSLPTEAEEPTRTPTNG
ncbi:DNA-directed RNA polymerase sigma-70 factor [Nocardiopsis terrae]|uniref:RNA polymerase sigma-70 factor (ECF subfamily) n=1 Tax=Nocardiopsis terrae TaxID=372655 RepID=A0ABR9HML7_9ACTN|nr:sigma-70 family RNA polymerase sigma factor [Nocardiopsis terrae]MBE1460247.1 RNA polymerase sigma-70 factor (ECF subfamily) [Nocardiopsis terrae]GHC70461.1 DNA-directed RNA polymerase sigma-70 factor [Nocardiopsis terrae]